MPYLQVVVIFMSGVVATIVLELLALDSLLRPLRDFLAMLLGR